MKMVSGFAWRAIMDPVDILTNSLVGKITKTRRVLIGKLPNPERNWVAVDFFTWVPTACVKKSENYRLPPVSSVTSKGLVTVCRRRWASVIDRFPAMTAEGVNPILTNNAGERFLRTKIDSKSGYLLQGSYKFAGKTRVALIIRPKPKDDGNVLGFQGRL